MPRRPGDPCQIAAFSEEHDDTLQFGVIKGNPLIREQKDKQMKEKNPDVFFLLSLG